MERLRAQQMRRPNLWAPADARQEANDRATALAKAEALEAREQALVEVEVGKTREEALGVAKKEAREKATEIAQVCGVVIRSA